MTMLADVPSIRTDRLTLESMSIPFMEALARKDVEAAGMEIGADVPLWIAEQLQHFLQFRLAQLAVDPSIRTWLGRAMVRTDEAGTRQVVGSLGFHGAPDTEGRLEVGYSVDPLHRRQGYAREAISALFDCAYRSHGITRFVASISPQNDASLNLAAQFGFKQVGEQMDDVDGLEYVFETTWPRPGSGPPR